MAEQTQLEKEATIRQAMKGFARAEGFIHPDFGTGEGCTAFVNGINAIMEANGSPERWELVPITTYKIQRIETP